MTQRLTEELNATAAGLNNQSASDVARLLHSAQCEALAVVGGASDSIAKGAAMMAATIRNGGTLVYAAAGSSALMALADAVELPGTFGINPAQIRVLMAGGVPTGSEMPGHTEDDAEEALKAAAGVGPNDLVIAVSASGSTAYPMAVATHARSAGASVISIANNNDAALFEHADIAICLPTPPEFVAGSTRLGAGTAQKVAMNMMSTLMGIALGHVHEGMMVNLKADNEKLRDRAVRMVSRIAGVDQTQAARHLETAGGSVKPAVLLAAGAGSLASAEALLSASDGHLGPAMAKL